MQVNRRDKIPKFVPLNDIVKLLRNAMIPPSQLPVEPDKRFPVSIKGVLLVDGARVVLAMNDREEWELPGGRIELGEDPARCVAREFEEELGLAVRATRLVDTYLFEVVTGKHVFIVTYGCELLGPFAPRLSDEHQAFGVFAVDALPARLPSGYRSSIQAWQAMSD